MMKSLLFLLLVSSHATRLRIKGSVYCGLEPIRAKIEVKDKEVILDNLLASFTTNVDPENTISFSPQCMEPSRFEIESTHNEFSGGDFHMIITPKCKIHSYCEEKFTLDWYSVEGGSTEDGMTGEFRKKLFGIDVCSRDHRDKAKHDPIGYEKWLQSKRASSSPPPSTSPSSPPPPSTSPSSPPSRSPSKSTPQKKTP